MGHHQLHSIHDPQTQMSLVWYVSKVLFPVIFPIDVLPPCCGSCMLWGVSQLGMLLMLPSCCCHDHSCSAGLSLGHSPRYLRLHRAKLDHCRTSRLLLALFLALLCHGHNQLAPAHGWQQGRSPLQPFVPEYHTNRLNRTGVIERLTSKKRGELLRPWARIATCGPGRACRCVRESAPKRCILK